VLRCVSGGGWDYPHRVSHSNFHYRRHWRVFSPLHREWLENFRLRQAARDIVSNLQCAKMKAISSRMEYRVRFDLATKGYLLEKNNGSWTQEGSMFHVPRGVAIARVTYNPPRVKFNPMAHLPVGISGLLMTKEKHVKLLFTTPAE